MARQFRPAVNADPVRRILQPTTNFFQGNIFLDHFIPVNQMETSMVLAPKKRKRATMRVCGGCGSPFCCTAYKVSAGTYMKCGNNYNFIETSLYFLCKRRADASMVMNIAAGWPSTQIHISTVHFDRTKGFHWVNPE